MNRIKELRKAKKITVKDLAEQLGIAQSMLTNYENGSSIPRDQSIWESCPITLRYLSAILWG